MISQVLFILASQKCSKPYLGQSSFNSLSKWIEDVRNERGHEVILFVVGNKLDCEEKRYNYSLSFHGLIFKQIELSPAKSLKILLENKKLYISRSLLKWEIMCIIYLTLLHRFFLEMRIIELSPQIIVMLFRDF